MKLNCSYVAYPKYTFFGVKAGDIVGYGCKGTAYNLKDEIIAIYDETGIFKYKSGFWSYKGELIANFVDGVFYKQNDRKRLILGYYDDQYIYEPKEKDCQKKGTISLCYYDSREVGAAITLYLYLKNIIN